jgi:hypothetical protein
MKIFENVDEITKKAKSLEEALGHKIEGLEEMAGKAYHTVGDKVGGVTEKIEIPEHNFNHSDILRDQFMLQGHLANQGYDWWWHSFTGHHAVTGQEKAFFIEFFTINPGLGTDVPILGQLPENRSQGKKPSYMMIKVGAWGEHPVQLHRFFAWDDVTIKEEAPYLISADNCFCSEHRTLGMVEVTPEEAAAHPEYMCDAGKMYWDLTLDKQIAFNVGYGAGQPMRDAEAFEMFWHCEGMKTAFEGKVVLDGEEYLVSKENSYGYADKNWGKDFTSPWVWLSSNHLVSKTTGEELKNSAFVIGGGRPKVGKLALENKLLGAMWYEGEPFEFNFSKFWTLTKTGFKCKETNHTVQWRVVQETPMAKMCTEITCQKSDMILVNYESPDGEKRHQRLWNGGNGAGSIQLYKKVLQNPHSLAKPTWEWELVDEIEVKNAGCEYGEYEEKAEKEESWEEC